MGLYNVVGPSRVGVGRRYYEVGEEVELSEAQAAAHGDALVLVSKPEEEEKPVAKKTTKKKATRKRGRKKKA